MDVVLEFSENVNEKYEYERQKNFRTHCDARCGVASRRATAYRPSTGAAGYECRHHGCPRLF